MNYKIVVDSSSDLLALEGVSFASAPLKIQAGEREFVDDANLDVAEMVEYLKHYTGRSGTASSGSTQSEIGFSTSTRIQRESRRPLFQPMNRLTKTI